MKKINIILTIVFLGNTQALFCNPKYDKAVIWGHKLHTHTHSYVHYAFYKAFKYLGYDTYWLDNDDNIGNINFANSLFITESLVDQGIPIRSDCTYILHNCEPKKYEEAVPKSQLLTLQVYTNDCENRKCTQMAPCILYDVVTRIIYMPWATDLLPYEIDNVKKSLSLRNLNKKKAVFIGSVGQGVFGNLNKITAFQKACASLGIFFSYKGGGGVDNEEGIMQIKESYLAPAIQGEWQCETGYIPCRIFKNISYGKLGITNNQTVYRLFNEKIVYNPDCYQLALDAHERMQNITQRDIFEQMDFVRDHHTYLNRINSLLTVLDLMKRHDY